MSPAHQIIKTLKKLPPFPLVAQRAMLLLDKPEMNIQDLVKVVKFDPAVTANILRISNSAYFRLSREINSLQQALLLLGTQDLLKIIIASGVTRLFSARTPGYFKERWGLWRHSVSCALMVDILAREVCLPGRTVGFTAGLLHDIGKLVLSLFVEQKFNEIMFIVEDQGVPFQAAEKIVLGIDHAEMGGEMARMWNFPDRLRLAISHHHLDKPEAYQDDLTLVVYLADLLVLMFGQNLGADGLAYTGYPEVLHHFRLKQGDLERFLLQFGADWREAQIFFGLT